MTGGGYVTTIGVGDSTTAAAVGQTDLQASSNKTFKTIASQVIRFILDLHFS